VERENIENNKNRELNNIFCVVEREKRIFLVKIRREK
jgi:hypothetical protein